MSSFRTRMLFFDTNPVGRLLNRFSKDISLIDDYMPYVRMFVIAWPHIPSGSRTSI